MRAMAAKEDFMKKYMWIWTAFLIPFVFANTAPHQIFFKENETVNAVLSSVDMNRLVVVDDQIQNISCPTNFCTISAQKNDQSGAVLISLNTQVPFVFYVTTKNQQNFGVFVTPQSKPATTTIFEYQASKLPSLTQLNKEAPYESLLADFMKAMIQFQKQQRQHIEGMHTSMVPLEAQEDMIKASVNHALITIPTVVFSSQELSGIVYRLINRTGLIQNIHASDYYSVSARAASVGRAVLGIDEETLLYVITSKGNEPWHRF
jgi:conjugal transfer pilus assembly protein TraK